MSRVLKSLVCTIFVLTAACATRQPIQPLDTTKPIQLVNSYFDDGKIPVQGQQAYSDSDIDDALAPLDPKIEEKISRAKWSDRYAWASLLSGVALIIAAIATPTTNSNPLGGWAYAAAGLLTYPLTMHFARNGARQRVEAIEMYNSPRR